MEIASDYDYDYDAIENSSGNEKPRASSHFQVEHNNKLIEKVLEGGPTADIRVKGQESSGVVGMKTGGFKRCNRILNYDNLGGVLS